MPNIQSDDDDVLLLIELPNSATATFLKTTATFFTSRLYANE